jgi:hypothetical protein
VYCHDEEKVRLQTACCPLCLSRAATARLAVSAAATTCCLLLNAPSAPQVFCDTCDGTCHGLGSVHARYALEPAALPAPCEEEVFGGPGDGLGAHGRVRALQVGVTADATVD